MYLGETPARFMGILLGAVLITACGSDGGSNGNQTVPTANVSAYLTDNLDGYDSVEFTLHRVQLRHTGSGRLCEIITGPLTVDAAELGRDEILEHVDTTTCEAGSYNRLRVELGDDVTLMRDVNGQPQTDQCKFVSYYDDHSPQPNRLACMNDICSLDITGAVNLVAGAHEHVALDADLKEFTVDYNVTPCEVTLKVSPLHGQGMHDKETAGYRKSISGFISGLDTQLDRFTLSHSGHRFSVEYAGVTDQRGIDTLLTRAANDALKTKVRCLSINFATDPPTCVAQSDANKPLKAITVKAEGKVSSLDTPDVHTFTLTYGNNVTLPVNYHEAVLRDEVEGTLADGTTVEVELYGFDLDYFLAREVEVQDD